MKTIKEIYTETGCATCFRIRHVKSLEDWAVGMRYEWSFIDNELINVMAMFLDGRRGVLRMLKKANVPEWICLSTKREVEWLKGFPPAMQWSQLGRSYEKVNSTKSGYF